MSIAKKEILRITFDLESPLIIGSGKDKNTDNDLIRNSIGDPYIPGTALAGVLRNLLAESGVSESEINDYFGYVATDPDEAKHQTAKDSRIVFYDANIVPHRDSNKKKYHITKRDFVALDEYKVAVKGAKFDMEVLEPGVRFVTYVEQNYETPDDTDMLSKVADCWKSGELRFGAKTMRGFGEIKPAEIKKTEFIMSDPEQVRTWLDSTIYGEDYWNDAEVLDLTSAETVCDSDIVLRLGLKLKSGISVRKYTTEPSKDGALVPQPDYVQLTAHGKNGKADPVIPGTSWAGAFRSNIRKLVKNLNEDCFGYVDEKNGKKAKSKILFSESRISGGYDKILTRNAIDRFSGGTVDGALYTEKTHYGGMTELEIRIYEKDPPEDLLRAFAASVADLHAGILSIGGLTSVGRGLFKVETINGIDAPDDPEQVFALTLSELKAERNAGQKGDVK